MNVNVWLRKGKGPAMWMWRFGHMRVRDWLRAHVRDWLQKCEGKGLASWMQWIGNARVRDQLYEPKGLAMRGRGTGYMNMKVWLHKGKGPAPWTQRFGYMRARDWLHVREGLATLGWRTTYMNVKIGYARVRGREGQAVQGRWDWVAKQLGKSSCVRVVEQGWASGRARASGQGQGWQGKGIWTRARVAGKGVWMRARVAGQGQGKGRVLAAVAGQE